MQGWDGEILQVVQLGFKGIEISDNPKIICST